MNQEKCGIPHNFAILLIGIASCIGALYLGYIRGYKEGIRYEQQHSNVIWKIGGNIELSSYRVASFDSGKTWYKIEEATPEYMAKVTMFDALEEYVKKNGPITLKPEKFELEKKILEKAGFQIKRADETKQ